MKRGGGVTEGRLGGTNEDSAGAGGLPAVMVAHMSYASAGCLYWSRGLDMVMKRGGLIRGWVGKALRKWEWSMGNQPTWGSDGQPEWPLVG